MNFVNPKAQAPNPKETQGSKIQKRAGALCEVGIWNLVGVWELGFGIYL